MDIKIIIGLLILFMFGEKKQYAFINTEFMFDNSQFAAGTFIGEIDTKYVSTLTYKIKNNSLSIIGKSFNIPKPFVTVSNKKTLS